MTYLSKLDFLGAGGAEAPPPQVREAHMRLPLNMIFADAYVIC